MSHSDESRGQIDETPSAAGQAEGPAVGGGGEPVTPSAAGQAEGPAVGGGEPVATESQPVAGDEGEGEDVRGGGKGKVAVAAAGTGAAVAGLAGGIAVAARDTRRRVLGVPLGKRSRFQRTASVVVDKAMEPGRRLTSRFSRG
jgi:hypothetical protein